MTGCFRDKKNIVQFVFCSEKNWPPISHTLPPRSLGFFFFLKFRWFWWILFIKRSTEHFWQAWSSRLWCRGWNSCARYACGFSWQKTTATYHVTMPSDDVSHWLGKTHILGLKHKSKEFKFKCNLVQLLPQRSSCTDRFGGFFFSFIPSSLKPEKDTKTKSWEQEGKELYKIN